MILDDLDIEIEDDDGTGVRNGTIRTNTGVYAFAVVDNKDVVPVGKVSMSLVEHWSDIEQMILSLI
jgi:hypothetical protein